jgi:hypothetical protein
VAILINALWHHLHIISGAGSRKAHALRASVEDVYKPPVMAKALALCTEVVCLVTLAKPTALGPTDGESEGVHQMLIA